MTQPYQPQQPRRRRADRHAGRDTQPAAPLRAGYQRDEEAPLPLDGYDAAPPPPQPQPTRQAPRVYAESDYHPPRRDPTQFSQTYDDYADEDYLPPRRWPWILLTLVLLAGFVLAGSYFLIPNTATGIPGQMRQFSAGLVDSGLDLLGLKKDEPPRLIKFDTSEDQVQTGVKTVFTFTADKPIQGIRILDEVGTEIKGVAEVVDAPNNTIWTLTAILDKPAVTTLSAGILVDKTWFQTDKTIQLTIAEPTAEPTQEPEPTIVPTAEPTEEPDSEPVTTPGTDPAAILPQQEQGQPQAQESAQPTPTQTPASLAALLPVFTPSQEQQQGAADDPQQTLPGAGEDLVGMEEPGTDSALDTVQEVPAWLQGAASDGLDDPAQLPGEGQAGDLPDDLADTPQDADALDEPPVEEPPVEEPPVQEPVQPAAPTPMPPVTLSAAEGQAPGKFNFTETVFSGARRQADYQRAEALDMQGGELYTYYPGGVFTFRGDGLRQNAAFGTADMALSQMSVHWQTDLGSLRTASGTVYGMGWTGQPAIIKWSVEVRNGMNIKDDKKDVKALKEVIFAAQDGKVYFLDLADGQPTRDPIEVGYPLRGSVTVDAFGRPLIAFGQAVSQMPGKTGDIGYYFYNLIDQSRAHFINGRRTKNQQQYGTNGAFDGTGLFERNTDTFVLAGENGLFYTVKMNTVFDFKNPTSLSISPETIYLRAKARQNDNTVSIEGSPAMYGPYAFYADKQGILRAVDTTSMRAVWAFDTGDNTDASPALDLGEDGTLALYTGTTVHARTRRGGEAVLRRVDALSGAEVWAVKVKAKYDQAERGGLKASPVVGQGQIDHLVIFTLNLTEEGGAIIALNKQTGQEAWRLPLSAGAISSPVAVYTPDGQARIVQADLQGRLYLIEGATGQVLHTLDLGGAVEGSPAVYNDILVVGTASRDNHKMYGIRLE